jgi:short-subunit dehydrogenase involved in D-alanine esterification of teichoic acids
VEVDTMRMSGNTVLITGGATGIGLALAEAFVGLGNSVVICGRRRHKLAAAKRRCPQLETRVCDVSRSASRAALVRWMERRFSSLNVLINNAGIQHPVDFSKGARDLPHADREIAPPIVATELAGRRRRPDEDDYTMSPGAVARQTVTAMETETYEVALGPAANLRRQRERLFSAINE